MELRAAAHAFWDDPAAPFVADAFEVARSSTLAVRSDRLVRDAFDEPALVQAVRGAARVFGISVGKASGAMHAGLVSRVPASKWAGGVVVSLRPDDSVRRAVNVVGSHPIPTEQSVAAADAIVRFLADQRLTEKDLVFACISGGTSAMIARPASGLTLADIQEVTLQLLRSGIDVMAINSVRRAMSLIHGGGLASLIEPARCVGLILCDNVQVGPAAVGSGPTYPFDSSWLEAKGIVQHHIKPGAVRDRVLSAIREREAEPRSAHDPRNIIVGCPEDALKFALQKGRELGYECFVLSNSIQGEAREVAKVLGSIFRYHVERNPGSRVCVLGVGEVTVTVTGTGRGGRCQELAWAMSRELEGLDKACFLAFATDGRDFIDGVGGAWVTGSTSRAIRERGLDWLEVLSNNDTHMGLTVLDQLIPGAATVTNVCDIYVFCAG